MQAAPIGNFIAHKTVLQCWQPSSKFTAITPTYHSAYIAPALTRALQKQITKALVQVQRPYRPQRPFTSQTPKSQNTSKSQNKLQVDYCPLFSISIRPLTTLAGGAAAFFISFFLTGVFFFVVVFLFLAEADFFFFT